MTRRAWLKLIGLGGLSALQVAGCNKPAEDKKERPLPPDRLPPDPNKNNGPNQISAGR
jgi:hypothetical protein